MNRHPEVEELQDYREELLSPERHQEIGAHLRECPACREELAAIQELMDDLAGLPEEAEPSRDLWPQIHWRLNGSRDRQAEPRRGRVVTLPVWQLLAAGIVLALVSGGVVWSALHGTAGGRPASMATAPATSPEAVFASNYQAFDQYTDAVEELEAVVEEGRAVLDPETIRVLEENLEVIDQAILESTEALAEDPGSRVLLRLLSETMRRKVDLLQRTAEIIIANT